MSSIILYPINYESHPNYVIREAFKKHFSPFEEYDWWNISNRQGKKKTWEDFLEILKDRKPDYCFMQLQNESNMTVEAVREMAKYTKIINWTGDIRQHKEWYDWFIAIGKEIHLTLFSNETDPELMAAAGVRADYLQVGFDHVWYDIKPKTRTDGPDIVYCANNNEHLQLAQYRKDVVLALKEEFKERFVMFGQGWGKYGIEAEFIRNVREAQEYNNAKIGISVSNFQFKRYYSDRLLRIMGCGALPMSHDFEGVEKDFKEGENIVIFRSTKDLIEKCNHYLANEKEREIICQNAYANVHANHNWDVRCKELLAILKKYE